jgi:hypothetical protein
MAELEIARLTKELEEARAEAETFRYTSSTQSLAWKARAMMAEQDRKDLRAMLVEVWQWFDHWIPPSNDKMAGVSMRAKALLVRIKEEK